MRFQDYYKEWLNPDPFPAPHPEPESGSAEWFADFYYQWIRMPKFWMILPPSAYDVPNIGVATPGSVEGLAQTIALVRLGILPPYITYSTVESLLSQGKVAMIISGPWAWSNLIASD